MTENYTICIIIMAIFIGLFLYYRSSIKRETNKFVNDAIHVEKPKKPELYRAYRCLTSPKDAFNLDYEV